MSNKFQWQQILDDVYDRFPEAQSRPVIGITANYADNEGRLSRFYYKSVENAGGVPIVIPPSDDTNTIINTLEHIDGLILSGGADFNPLYCGEEPSNRLHSINSERDLFELLITRLAYNRQMPMLGICRGIQTLAMALGGRVEQDISNVDGVIKHSQDADRSVATHSVEVDGKSVLHEIYGSDVLYVNSFHHQAVAECGDKFRITAHSVDGVIEAMESCEFKPIIGVQWHPECMEEGLPLFQWLVKQAALYDNVKRLHRNILTLDTHCDTPMLFPKGISFDRRDKTALVDLHKMTEGRLDATIMVAYLQQPKPDETFESIVRNDYPSESELKEATPKGYADMIFDRIESLVELRKDYIRIAKTPAELYENKRQGRKSIMLGIENALALNGNIDNVDYFANRGIVYMTLCHNGDNDVCDSAKGCNTHNGVSPFGEKVIAEMNRLGVMVDMSHAGEKSFYDALEISSMPIVCSHSSSRALCDHPRNLTDNQMRLLARKGGVAQITLYPGFLRTDGKATVIDALEHLDHAISIMGIEHVGLGTDFDGDGGVPGVADASELINFTRMLLARRFSPEDIQLIMGGNFLRVMEKIQMARRN